MENKKKEHKNGCLDFLLEVLLQSLLGASIYGAYLMISMGFLLLLLPYLYLVYLFFKKFMKRKNANL